MNSREQFEIICRQCGLSGYTEPLYDFFLATWEASRACMEVELPDWHYQNGSSAVFVSDIKAAIESQGIKVKV